MIAPNPMTILRLHDRTRTPRDWTGVLRDDQYAVFLSDVEKGFALTPEGHPAPRGQPAVCYVFDSLETAEAFCRERIERFERMSCEIYDRRGKAIDPIRTFTHEKFASRQINRRSARQKILIGYGLLAIAPLLFWLDYRHAGLLVVPTVVGFACIVTCFRLLWWGYSERSIIDAREAARDGGDDKVRG
jgi:hypothetical protein